ncbi:hypothetical protein RIR_jg19799.t1 [Rhizophagus irregularis DAOM 181602=DAOM 197198]|nr:hypothetical protein RIR_jg19799.t1 [Rhizophagus irregularis DAOM 181602=DAOM 197198]
MGRSNSKCVPIFPDLCIYSITRGPETLFLTSLTSPFTNLVYKKIFFMIYIYLGNYYYFISFRDKIYKREKRR